VYVKDDLKNIFSLSTIAIETFNWRNMFIKQLGELLNKYYFFFLIRRFIKSKKYLTSADDVHVICFAVIHI